MSELLTYFRDRQDDMITLLTGLVERESFTSEKDNVDKLVDFIVDTVSAMNPSSVTRIPLETVGDIVIAKWNEDAPNKPIMALMHIDTVWQQGTLARRPVRIDDDGRLYGPGASDMKGGVAAAISAVQGLVERDELPDHPLWLMFTTDEETGSIHSESYIRDHAAQCGLVMVMEPPNHEGSLKTSRKGVARYAVETTGRASHAGNHPEEGINAILEMAQQIVAISKLQDLRNGISVAVNRISGGEATNIIAPHARIEIDVRTITQADMDRVHEELMDLRPKIPGAQVETHLMGMRGPMERDDLMERTFKQAQQIGVEIGVKVTEDSVGGGSDGNIVAGMGIPVLDGLGPKGAGLHAEHEHIIIRSLPERAAHLAAIMRDWSFD